MLTEIHSPSLIHLTDSSVSSAFLRKFVMSNPGVPWYGFVRCEEIFGDEDFARQLGASGCAMLELGVESGDDRVLESINKGITVTRAESVLKSLTRAGISTFVYLLFGTPAEDEEAAFATLDFAERNAEYIDYLNFAIFNLPINGRQARLLTTSPFYAGDLTLYADFEHPQKWSRKADRAFLARESSRRKGIRAIINRKPPSFTSNHAPFFAMADIRLSKRD